MGPIILDDPPEGENTPSKAEKPSGSDRQEELFWEVFFFGGKFLGDKKPIPHLPFPYIFGTRGYSYLIYWQLGGWFQIYRELEDQGMQQKVVVFVFFSSFSFDEN